MHGHLLRPLKQQRLQDGAMYDVHFRLIGKRAMDFLLVLIELFSIGVTAEALRAISS